jgi:23S rRNA maturation-related 3'-5' exoribonuclease YhaM
MGIKIELSRDEIFLAISEYVEKRYPVCGNYVTIDIQNNKILGATVNCTWKQKQQTP